MEFVKFYVQKKYGHTLECFDLSLNEFLKWCDENSLFEACAYGKKIEWWR